MTTHACPRCGLETRCSHGSWPDRHPAAAVAFAVPVTVVGLGAIAAYPWLFMPLLILAGVAYVVDREHRRRPALATRADYEHHALVVAPVPSLLAAVRMPRVQSRNRTPSPVVAELPTKPLRAR